MNLSVVAVILLLILVNALYVAAEFAAVSVRRSRIQQRAEEGNWFAIRLLPYVTGLHRLDRYIATSQIGITISSLVLGAYGQTQLAPVMIPLFEGMGGMQAAGAESAAFVVVLLVLTAASMILGELVPKSLALQYPTHVALYTLLPMQWSLRGLSWFISLLNGSGRAVVRLFGVKQGAHVHIHSPEEIEYLIAESRQVGLIEPDEHARLRRALHLGTVRVSEVMVPHAEIFGIEAGTPFGEILDIAADSRYTRLPVYQDTIDHIIGYVHVQDIARHALDGGEGALLRSVSSIPDDLTLDRVLERFRTERQHMALVSDEFGGTAGLITVSDILQEILGGVADDFEPPESAPERMPDGRIRLPGSLRLEDAAGLLSTDWEGESSTLGGFLVERIERLPRVGERLVIDGVRVEVEGMAGSTVASVLAVPATEQRGGETP
ncbi:MAG TPA: HlyC/CorC family transporter [Gemmatimonadetes bacterium]|nr:HlyC/CorC family transporter [Gemmatimonadota bacterium]|tara:strand:+ start:2731 stop:4038 length:1308 start_codon:yes stop_codon:yes gene_type:complete